MRYRVIVMLLCAASTPLHLGRAADAQPSEHVETTWLLAAKPNSPLRLRFPYTSYCPLNPRPRSILNEVDDFVVEHRFVDAANNRIGEAGSGFGDLFVDGDGPYTLGFDRSIYRGCTASDNGRLNEPCSSHLDCGMMTATCGTITGSPYLGPGDSLVWIERLDSDFIALWRRGGKPFLNGTGAGDLRFGKVPQVGSAVTRWRNFAEGTFPERRLMDFDVCRVPDGRTLRIDRICFHSSLPMVRVPNSMWSGRSDWQLAVAWSTQDLDVIDVQWTGTQVPAADGLGNGAVAMGIVDIGVSTDNFVDCVDYDAVLTDATTWVVFIRPAGSTAVGDTAPTDANPICRAGGDPLACCTGNQQGNCSAPVYDLVVPGRATIEFAYE